MAFGSHSWVKAGLVLGYGVAAASAATLYGSVDGHEHGGALHAHGSGAASTSGHAHPGLALLVAAAGLGIVALTWLLVPKRPRGRLQLQLALCSAAGATIHFAVVVPHWDEYFPFALLFAVTGAFQFLWAPAVLARPARRLVLAGAVVNLGVAAAWVLSRTAGMPIGPDAWTPEAVGVPDAAATVFELATAAGSVLLLSPAANRFDERIPRAVGQLAAVAVAVTLLFALALL